MGILGKKKTTKKDETDAKKALAAKASSADEKKKAAAAKTVKKDDGKKAEKKDAPKREVDLKNVLSYGVIREPVFTEKAEREQAKGQYTFYVDSGANKVQIADAIKVLYGVQPAVVRILNVKGKKVRFGRSVGRRKDRKKAIVTLKPGDSIAVMD